jgi:soluble lytic murein transglycosylase-like protein
MVPIAFFSVARMLIGVFLRLRWQAKVVVSTLLFVGVVVITLMLSQAAQERVIAAFFAPSVQYWARDIRRWSVQYEVDPNLIATVMQIESCGLPSAESISRAQGLFQVMPFHFPDEEKASMTDPEINAKRGMGVLKDCLARANGDAGLAMACYNGGPSVLLRGNWPNETTRYYYWGTGIYADASSGSRSSGRLTEWLEAGGLSLCQQASAALGVPAASLSTPANEQPSYSSGTLPDAPSVLPTFDSTRR